MKLIDNWRAELNRLWSIRVAVFMAIVASADQILQGVYSAGFIPPWLYGALSMGIVVYRLVKQNDPGTAP